MARVLIALRGMRSHHASAVRPSTRRVPVHAVAFALCLTAGFAAPESASPGPTNPADDRVSGTESVAESGPNAPAPAAGTPAGAETAQAAATGTAVEESPDRREILPGLTMGSQLRLRTESRRNVRFDRARPGNDEDYLLSRLRFDLAWEPNDRAAAVVELQDARIHGEQAISETRTPNLFADQLDIHQAYLDVRSPVSGSRPVSLRIGRQKLVYGAERMVSPLEWVNTARVFDGARITAALAPGRTLDAFATRLVPVTPTALNDHRPTGSRMFNSQLHGIYYSDAALAPGATVEGYWLLRRAAQPDDAVHTLGARVDARHGAWAFDGEAAIQTGRFDGLDHRATSVHVGGSYATRLPGALRLGAAFNLGSGDDAPDDGVHGTFDQLYPLGHAYYGAMDLFGLQNLRNAEVTVEAALPGGATFRAALQDFALLAPGADAWYNVGGAVTHRAATASVSSHVGNELDVTIRLPVGPVRLEAGYGRFFGGAYLRETGFAQETADFFYLQTMVGF